MIHPQYHSTRRFGFTLIEILIALPLAALITSVAIAMMYQQGIVVRTSIAEANSIRELRHTRMILDASIGNSSHKDLKQVSDSLIELASQMGIGSICDFLPPDRLVVSTEPNGSDSAWVRSVRAGDEISGWVWTRTLAAPPVPISIAVTSAPSEIARGSCRAGLPTRLWEIRTRPMEAGLMPRGLPIRFLRATRYSHYRSGGKWWIGRRTHDLHGWDTVQPLAGPFRSNSQGGMRVVQLDHSGSKTSNRDSVAALQISLSVPRSYHRIGALADSITFIIALRGSIGERE